MYVRACVRACMYVCVCVRVRVCVRGVYGGGGVIISLVVGCVMIVVL